MICVTIVPTRHTVTSRQIAYDISYLMVLFWLAAWLYTTSWSCG